MGILSKFKKAKEEPKAGPVTSAHVEVKPSAPVATLPMVSDVIVRPHVTEKAAVLGSQRTYVFVVRKDANRTQVQQAVKEMYGVLPTRVNIQNVEGKWKRFGCNTGKRSDWKKALVTLPEGKSINVHEGV